MGHPDQHVGTRLPVTGSVDQPRPGPAPPSRALRSAEERCAADRSPARGLTLGEPEGSGPLVAVSLVAVSFVTVPLVAVPLVAVSFVTVPLVAVSLVAVALSAGARG